MIKVGVTEFQQNAARYEDLALTQPVTVTRGGKARTVMISAKEYQRLRLRDREVLRAEDLTDDDLAAIAAARPPIEADAFNGEDDR